MIKIIGNELWRGGEKIGWVDDNHIRTRDGKKLGYFQDRFVYNMEGDKLARIEEDYLISMGSGDETKMRLEQIAGEVEGGVLSELGKCAIYVLMGD